MIKDLKIPLNVGSVIIIILIMMLKHEIIVILLENKRLEKEALHKEIVISNLKLNDKIPFVFHILKNYDSDLIMQELGKFNLKIKLIPNGLKKIYEPYYQ